MNAIRNTIAEIKNIENHVAHLAQQEKMSMTEVVSLLQTGCAKLGDDRMIGVLGIVKNRIINEVCR